MTTEGDVLRNSARSRLRWSWIPAFAHAMNSMRLCEPARRALGRNDSHLIASGLTGEPTAPVIGIAGPTNMNS